MIGRGCEKRYVVVVVVVVVVAEYKSVAQESSGISRWIFVRECEKDAFDFFDGELSIIIVSFFQLHSQNLLYLVVRVLVRVGGAPPLGAAPRLRPPGRLDLGGRAEGRAVAPEQEALGVPLHVVLAPELRHLERGAQRVRNETEEIKITR